MTDYWLAERTAADFGLDPAAIRRAHRARWTRVRAGWDATCTCGEWSSRTGGAIRAAVVRAHAGHVEDAVWATDAGKAELHRLIRGQAS